MKWVWIRQEGPRSKQTSWVIRLNATIRLNWSRHISLALDLLFCNLPMPSRLKSFLSTLPLPSLSPSQDKLPHKLLTDSLLWGVNATNTGGVDPRLHRANELSLAHKDLGQGPQTRVENTQLLQWKFSSLTTSGQTDGNFNLRLSEEFPFFIRSRSGWEEGETSCPNDLYLHFARHWPGTLLKTILTQGTARALRT